MAATASPAPAPEVERLLGAPLSLAAPERLAAYALDGTAPRVAAFPETPEQVGALLALANSHGWGVVPWGGGHGMGEGAAPRPYDVALCLSRLEKLLDHDPDNLTLVAEGGLVLAEANRRMSTARQMLPLGLPGDRGTLGGIVAAARPAPKRLLYGDVRDNLIGIRVALADGTLVRYGRKVIKNVAGYDMNKLFLGSHGMVGVVVETIFKLSALPDDERCVPGAFPDLASAAAAAGALLASSLAPACLLLFDSHTGRALREAARITAPEGEALLLVGFEGRSVALRRQVEAAAAIITGHGGEPGEPGGALTEAVGTLLAAPPAPGDKTGAGPRDGAGDAPALRLRLGTTPGELPALCAHVKESAAALGMEAALLADYGAGAVQAVLPWPEAHKSAELAGWIGALREAVRPQRGYVTLQAAPPELKQAAGVWSGLEGEGDIMALLKARFDPNNILAPGRFLPDA